MNYPGKGLAILWKTETILQLYGGKIAQRKRTRRGKVARLPQYRSMFAVLRPGKWKVTDWDEWNEESEFGHCPACGSWGREDAPCSESPNAWRRMRCALTGRRLATQPIKKASGSPSLSRLCFRSSLNRSARYSLNSFARSAFETSLAASTSFLSGLRTFSTP